MNKLMIVLACLDVLVLALLLMGYPQRWFLPETAEESSSNILYYTPETLSSQESSGAYAMASHVTVYTVRTYEGRIGIFLNDSKVPFEELDVDVGLLPEADQVLLEEGIRVTDREHLNRLIEDYES